MTDISSICQYSQMYVQICMCDLDVYWEPEIYYPLKRAIRFLNQILNVFQPPQLCIPSWELWPKKVCSWKCCYTGFVSKKYMYSSSNDHINPLWGHQPSSHPAYRSAKGIHCYKPGEKGDFYCGPWTNKDSCSGVLGREHPLSLFWPEWVCGWRDWATAATGRRAEMPPSLLLYINHPSCWMGQS